jgi:glycosyltransferase involved in cell wall biosynthesis
MTQSNFCKNVFSNQISDSSKIHVIPYIIPAEFSPKGPRIRKFKDDTFVFGSVFEWVSRKMPELMIEAFMREFKQHEPVRLILKVQFPFDINFINPNNPQQTLIYNAIQNIRKDPRIMLNTDLIPKISEFYRGLDAYISCTAGEGWGQTLSEAMACGIPTIASNHSGNLDFMNENNSYLVDVEEWSPTIEFPNLCWKKPKIESIQKVIRQVYEEKNSEIQKQKILNAIKIKNLYTQDIIGKEIRQIIEPLI